MAHNKALKISLCVDERKRVAAFFQLLITIEKRAAPARDKNGRFAKNPKSKQKTKLTPSQIRLAKKAGLISFYSIA
ncbi:MAG: hypothetical protein P4L31_04915, partial [Candidatus Babeliales bacterium]|nr:hypothetical protein [Candidatus Babeliales bacterium]